MTKENSTDSHLRFEPANTDLVVEVLTYSDINFVTMEEVFSKLYQISDAGSMYKNQFTYIN